MNKTHQLLNAAREGNPEALVQIYNEYSSLIYYTALRLLGSEHDAQDMVQDVMLSLFETMPSLQKADALPAYLRRMTHNRCINFLKRENRLQPYEEEVLAGVFTSERKLKTEFIPEEYYLQEERHAHVIEQVEALTPPLKSAVLLFYFEQLPVAEIAKILDISKAAVKSRLFRAREALAKSLAEYEEEEAFALVPVTVLGKILKSDAANSFSADIQQGIWQNIGGELGISATELSAQAAAMTGEAAAISGTAASGGVSVPLLAVSALAAIATVAYFAFPLIGTYWGDSPASPTITQPLETAPPSEEIPKQQEITIAFPALEEESPLPSSEGNLPVDTSEPAEQIETQLPAEMQRENSPPPSAPLSEAEEAAQTPPSPGTGSALALQLAVDRISLPIDTQLTPALILEYAQPFCSNAEVVYTVEGLDAIPPDTAGEFPVYIFAVFDDARIGRAMILDVYEATPGAQESAAQDNFSEDEST